MTLIATAVEESLSCKSEDEGEVGISWSPENKQEIVEILKENNAAVLQTTLNNNNTKLEHVLVKNESNVNNLSVDKSQLIRSELNISLKNCDKESTSPLVIYKCSVSVESSPKSCSTNDVEAEPLDNCKKDGTKPLSSDKCPDEFIRCNATDVELDHVTGLVSLDFKVVDGICEASSLPSQSIDLSNHTEQSSSEPFVETSVLSPSGQCFLVISDDEGDLHAELDESSKSTYKTKLKTLMQRRTVSESNSVSLGSTKKSIETLRHSFSSSEHCDNVQIDVDIILNKCKYNDKDALLNSSSVVNMDPLMHKVDNDSINIPVLKTSPRKVAEITDTLVYNVKKSMIEEYQNLKKENSSLVSDINYSSPNNCISLVNKYKSHMCRSLNVSQGSNGFQNNDIENFKSVKSVDKSPLNNEMCVSKSASIGIPLCSNSKIQQNIKLRDGFIPLSSSLDSERMFEPTLNGCDKPSDSDLHEDKSSPPSRLETWKNLLAEKRNSLKGNLKDINKCGEVHQEVVDINNYNTFIDSSAFVKDSFSCHEKSSKEDVKDSKICSNLNNISDDRLVLVIDEPNVLSGYLKGSSKEYSNVVNENVNQNYIDNRNDESMEECNNFAKVSSVEISACYKPSNDSDVKMKFQGACQDIAKALYSIPVMSRSDMENNNGIISNESFVNIVQLQESCVQTCFSSNIGCDKNNIHQLYSQSELESNLSAMITTIKPPIVIDLMYNEKSQQCPTPPPETINCEEDSADDTKDKGSAFTSSEEDSDYCQTDECGDDCDYCSGDDAEDEEDDTCNLCRQSRSLSPVCKHTRVMTNGSLRRQRLYDENGTPPRLNGSRSLVIQAALRRRRLNTQELSAIREYSITSDEQLDSDEDQSQDDNMCDLSSSWRFGLCREPVISRDSTLRSNRSVASLPCVDKKMEVKIKSNSLPVSSLRKSLIKEYSKRPGSAIIRTTSNSDDELIYVTGINLPRRPPRVPKNHHHSCNLSYSKAIPLSMAKNPRPTMGLQGLQQRPSFSRLTQTGRYPTGPKTLAPRSPLNPNPPFGFPCPPSLPVPCSGSSPLLGRRGQALEVTGPPGSPRTCSRSGALVTRNFSISDDEGGQRLSRRQVTITRHESVYREAADKGYHIAPCSPIDPYWLTWKLGVLQKTLEDVSSRLEESEKVVTTWGPIPHDSNLADQHVHNVRKFRENTADLQRGVDDVNDQAARFSAHNIPLTPQNSAALHDLNNRWKNLETTVNDRWRQVAGRSREVTPLTPAQLASSVNPPWERATATNKVPYYINHSQETTHWDHPIMMDLLDSLADYNHIKFSAYRTASKLRSLQKKLSLDRAKLQLVTDVFDEHGLRGQNDRLIDVNDMIVVLSTLYGRISADHMEVNTAIATDLCLNWLLNVYDSQRTGQMRVLSFRVGLICLCRGHLEEKYRYMFRLIADPNRLVDQRKLGLLLHDCVQVPRQLGEVAAFGGSNIEPSVRSCFTKAGKDRENIEAVHFLTWVQQEPQSLVWLAVLHRVAASESVQHQVKCNICKTYPITGLRYRCLKCLSFDMCQRCFFDGRSSKSHKITHPMHEYCTATTAGDEMKDFTKALKNKFKSKRSLQKHTKKGYLPVQTVLEGDPLESPSPSPSHNVSSQDMHSRLELYASRLAEVELRTNSNSTPDSEDEHGLIAQYCQSLSSSDAPFPVPKSPLQIMASVDADQKDELEQMIRDLEEENQALQAEYERLKSQQPTGSALDDGMGQRSEAEMLAEAKLLREHKGRLEARMSILEDHNRQLEAQLQRLRQLLVEQQGGMGSPNKSGTLQTKSVTASQLAMDSPAKINGHSSHGDLEKAVGNLVDSMNPERVNDSRSDDNSDENDYDNTGINQAPSIN